MADNDFEMRSGDTKTLLITVKDKDGALVNIADSRIRWQLARSVNAQPVLEKSTDDVEQIEIIDGPAGRVNVYITQDDTESLRGNFYHELEVVLSNDAVGTPISGAVVILPDLIHKE